ncbi:placenta-specific protein 9 isoform X1 [Papio anubis]|uniref:placenta-specific protein 9 isoform X1 n=1 Tax=Papio anubis TaxID=9555 RepID=UPI0012AE4BDA|nr:placenta-specific protein 9 isoform X1 [Papio anubis]
MGCRGASGGGGFSQARKPGAAQEFWLELRAFPPGPAGRDPGRAAAGRRGAALCRAGTMRPLLCALAGLALLRAAGSLAAAEPFSPPRGDSAQSTVCDRHMAVQRRLDVMEEMVEKTVDHLGTEVKGLLGLLEELAWNLPPGPFSPTPDLLGEDGF